MRFAGLVWLVTRALIFFVATVATPRGISALGSWDGAWYGSIAVHGYEYARDGAPHSVAFFPLFPILASILMKFGIRWPFAGIAVNNAAFLACVLLLYRYARMRFGTIAARWCVVAVCVSPLSLFCTAAYSEGLFMLFTAAALFAYDREHYALAGIAAACASATRPLGVALAVALIAAAILQQRGPRAVLQTCFGLAGIALFTAFCAARYNDPLAYVHAQLAWRHAAGFDASAWLALLRGAFGGRVHDWISLLMIAIAACGIAFFRRALGVANVSFLVAALALFVLAGTPFSADRNLYTVLPISMVLAMLFQRIPVAGYAFSVLGLIALVTDTLAFLHFQWVA